MRTRNLRAIARDSAALLRSMRTHTPPAALVYEVQCPRCRRWVKPGRFDTLCLSCKPCKKTDAATAERGRS